MKKLTVNQMEVLNGGVCEPGNEHSPFPCRPSVCTGTAIAIIASGGNYSGPIIICTA